MKIVEKQALGDCVNDIDHAVKAVRERVDQLLDEGSFLARFLGFLNVFGIWGTIVAAIGLFLYRIAFQPLAHTSVLVLLIADLGFYIAHRMFHMVPFLWRFHSVHHSIEEMDWLAAHRQQGRQA